MSRSDRPNDEPWPCQVYLSVMPSRTGGDWSLVEEDVSLIHVRRIVDTSAPPSPQMKFSSRGSSASTSRRSPRVWRPWLGEQTVGVVLDQRHAMVIGDRSESLHVARDPRIVHGHDRLDPLVHGGCDVIRVEPEIGSADVAEADLCSLASERRCRRREGERRDDHDVAGLEVEEHGGHLERIGARGGEQNVERPSSERRSSSARFV